MNALVSVSTTCARAYLAGITQAMELAGADITDEARTRVRDAYREVIDYWKARGVNIGAFDYEPETAA